ncbi:MAG: MotA/TolQ/ExbB proton channel family protein [Myxococcales bacterium]|nr:MotA/TolQ/ExbB proton channel family protein [Myxococcales bacterium]
MLRYLLDAFAGPAAPFMYALLAILAFATAVGIERTITLMACRVEVAAVLRRAEAAVRDGVAPSWGGTPLETVLAAGFAQAEPELGWEAMQAAAVDAEQRIRRRIPYLAAVASIATMVGLFGTVYGLIQAFGAMGGVAAAERAARLSEGSSTAMAATAFGLFVAIPALAAHSALEAQARGLLAEIEATAGRVHVLRRGGSG